MKIHVNLRMFEREFLSRNSSSLYYSIFSIGYTESGYSNRTHVGHHRYIAIT